MALRLSRRPLSLLGASFSWQTEAGVDNQKGHQQNADQKIQRFTLADAGAGLISAQNKD
jgi:hypothetical protein